MNFPDDFAEKINEAKGSRLIEIKIINGDTKKTDTNFKSWTVI